jgi:hypothetical protein
MGRRPSEAARTTLDEAYYRHFILGQRLPWWVYDRYQNSQAVIRTEWETLRAQRWYAKRARRDGQIHGEIAGPDDFIQFSDRIERCAQCDAPYTDSMEAEETGDPDFDLCPRCRRFPEEDLLLNAIERGIDDEALDRLIEHYATLKENRERSLRLMRGGLDGKSGEEDGAEDLAR